MTPSTKNNANTASKARPADDFMSLQELLRLCLANWKWFALSLAACLCAAAAYLLTTPPVYTRSASILVKADSKGQSVTDAAGVLGNIDIFQTNTNVNNELISMQSPAVMLDVVKRLDLDVDYATDGEVVCPLKDADFEPDVVAVIDIPERVYWFEALHLRHGGGRAVYVTAPFQCACADVTAYPLMKQTVNISIGCFGCRKKTDMKSDEMAIGIPYAEIPRMAEDIEVYAEGVLTKAKRD